MSAPEPVLTEGMVFAPLRRFFFPRARARRQVADSPDSPWMSAEEAAAYLRAPLSRVRKMTMIGELPHYKDGRRVLYHRDELDDFIRSTRKAAPASLARPGA